MMASWLIMLIALPLFAICVAGFVVIVLAMTKTRSGPAVLGGAAGLLSLLVGGGLLFSFVAHQPRWHDAEMAEAAIANAENYPIDASPWAADELPINSASSGWTENPGGIKTTWNISLTPLLFIVCGGVALTVLALKRGFGHACAGGHGRIWPAFLALPVIAIFMLGGVRYHRSQSAPPPRVAVSQARAQVSRAPKIALKPQKVAAKNQGAYSSRTTRQIDQKDIRELMDEFDAPRIVLQAPLAAVASPAAMIVVTLPTTTIEIAVAADDPHAKSIAKNANVLSSKLKSSPKGPNPFAGAPEAVTASEAVAEVPPVAPAPPTPPTPSTTPPVKTFGIAENHIESSSDRKADFQFAAANTARADTFQPAWLDERPKKTGDTRREVIVAGPYATSEECYRAADIFLILKTYEHVQSLRGTPYQEAELPNITFQKDGLILVDGKPFATGTTNPAWMDFRPSYLQSLGLGIDFIRRELIAKDPKNKNETREYLATVDSSVGPMQQLYRQLEFTKPIDTQIKLMLDAAERQDRFKIVGLGAGSVLGMLSMAWGLLKLDTATKGYYSKWLFLGVPAAIIGATIVSMIH